MEGPRARADGGADANDEFDPEAAEEREIGREMVDQSTGLGSVAAHMYRGEVERMVGWRDRMDQTTTWAVSLTAAIVAYAYSDDDISHVILLVAMGMGLAFLHIEARRFQSYDVWRSRVRVLQQDLFANALDPSAGVEHDDWRERLSQDYRNPELKMPYREAVGHRLRRVYLPLLLGILFAWLFRLLAYAPEETVVESAAIPGIPGTAVLGAVASLYAVLLAIAFLGHPDKARQEASEADHGDFDRSE